ncbi:MAG: type II secretion system protein [Planctomycetota bacterium]
MKRQKGFTLIELLVVIAIIALLLSVIMPSLNLAKQKARAVVCKSNLKQWGVMFTLYTQENNDSYMSACDKNGNSTGTWVIPLRPYYGSGSSKDIRLCPSTSPTKSDPFLHAWTSAAFAEPGESDYASSYGINNWLYNPPNIGSSLPPWLKTKNLSNCWRKTTNITNAGAVPVFLECWRWGGMPESGDTPLANRPQSGDSLGNGVSRYNLDRHQSTVNVLFADSSVEKVTMRGLWGLKWHKEYSPGAEVARMENKWPDWMKK